jgi:hypothetical protein
VIRHLRSEPDGEHYGDITPIDVVTCAAVDELDYEPRNPKEKWLLRIVYWGTIALVAFFWWEYVKAR